MKKTMALLAALLLASAGMTAVQAHAAETGKEEQVITRVGTRPSAVGSHATFTGNVRHAPLFSPNEAAPYSVPMSPLSREPVPSGIPIRQVSVLWSYPAPV